LQEKGSGKTKKNRNALGELRGGGGDRVEFEWYIEKSRWGLRTKKRLLVWEAGGGRVIYGRELKLRNFGEGGKDLKNERPVAWEKERGEQRSGRGGRNL